MTKGETLYLAVVLVTFVSFAIMLAYHDHQYRSSKRGAVTQKADASDHHAHA